MRRRPPTSLGCRSVHGRVRGREELSHTAPGLHVDERREGDEPVRREVLLARVGALLPALGEFAPSPARPAALPHGNKPFE